MTVFSRRPSPILLSTGTTTTVKKISIWFLIIMRQLSVARISRLSKRLSISIQLRKASSKEAKSIRNAMLFPAGSSAENAVIPSSAGFTCTVYKYTAWSCNTHILDKQKCSMLYVKDETIKQAFCTMMNKLIFAHRIILKPYVDALKNMSTDDSLRRIQEIETLLAQNTEKRETLTRLMTQGIIDQILSTRKPMNCFRRQTAFAVKLMP